MATPILGEIKIFSFGFAPKGWAFCNGQLLPINQNQALFSILGTTYGGNGQTTFALPDLQGRVPVYAGQGLVLGQPGGEINHTLTTTEMAAHSHSVGATTGVANKNTMAGNIFASGVSITPYGNPPNTPLDPATIGMAGGNQPHSTLMPYEVLNMCIALQGVFPSRS